MASPAAAAKLFQTIKFRGLTLKNRLAMSPMCQYNAFDGIPNDHHLIHYGSRAAGGVGLIIAEATGVHAAGRISPHCTGIYTDEQVAAWKSIVRVINHYGSVPGIQLAHAGRKGSCAVPWVDGGRQLALDETPEAGWETIAPSAVPFNKEERPPKELTVAEIKEVVEHFRQAARNALSAGFKLLEVHAAHGYLLHEFLSPLSNKRTDEYGGSFENRSRLVKEVVRAVREVMPEDMPLFIRISATDWAEHSAEAIPAGQSWTLEQSIQLAKELKPLGVDLVDASSGAIIPNVAYPAGPAWQAPLAAAIRKEAGVATGAVGMITEAKQAEALLQEGGADIVFLGRALLDDPYWPLHAAAALGQKVQWPLVFGKTIMYPHLARNAPAAAAAATAGSSEEKK